MRPGQTTPNELELAVLKQLQRQEPSISLAPNRLRVLSREYAGVGSFTTFQSVDPARRALSLDGVISIPGGPEMIGAVLFYFGDQPECLEFFTYDGSMWDGRYEGFSIDLSPSQTSAGNGPSSSNSPAQ